MPEQSFSATCIFSTRHISAFLPLGTLDSTSALPSGPILDSEITYKKAHKGKKCSTKCARQRTLVYSARAETRRKSTTLFDLSWELTCHTTQMFHCSAHVRESPKLLILGCKYTLVSRQICKNGILE